jgi:hypothetical protein
MTCLAALLVGCAAASRGQPAKSSVASLTCEQSGPPPPPTAAATAATTATSIAAAPPALSQTSSEEPDPDEQAEARPREGWLDADACAAPAGSGEGDVHAYAAFIDRALGLTNERGQLAAVRATPAFHSPRALEVARRRDGSYVLRSTTVPRHVWTQVTTEMMALPGYPTSIDESFQTAALARLTPTKLVRERPIDARTAALLADLWRAIITRAQVVVPINAASGKADGTVYELRQGSKAATTHSPAAGSILGDLVLTLEHLQRVLDDTSTDPAAELERARDLMRSALDRTRKNEPCLRRHVFPPD